MDKTILITKYVAKETTRAIARYALVGFFTTLVVQSLTGPNKPPTKEN